jgi:lipopolysaccharide transport system permease protein
MACDMILGIWDARELTWILFRRDLKAKYRESYLGYLWLIAPPLTTMLVWVFLNAQRIVQVETDIPYPLFVLIGTTVWSSFAGSLMSPLASFKEGAPVFMKLRVAPEAFVLSGFYGSVFDLLIRLFLLIPLFLYFKYIPPFTALLFPLAVIMLLTMGLAAGLSLIPIGGFYGDVGNAVSTFVGLLMFTVPVVYPVPEGEGLFATVMRYNPLTPAVTLCRETLTSGDLTFLPAALAWFAAALLVTFFALLILRIALPHLVERMGM